MTFGLLQFLTILGSLSLFLYGMKVMSQGIQKFAGDKLRNIFRVMTTNRFFGILTGFVVTSLVQSSSATTVMVVGFVNAGLLNLSQSIGVIMGANIGTTITAWLVSVLGFQLNISGLSLPIIAIGFPLLYFARERLSSLGETILGFALLFLGWGLLKDSVPDWQSNAEAFSLLQNLTDFGPFSTLLFLFIGILLTTVLQSSSATIALTLVMCNNGWIGFEHGAIIVLGENIGTTITANLAALVGNVNAKRAAISHTIFNVFGVIWMLFFYSFVLGLIADTMMSMGFNSPYNDPSMIPLGISIFHSAFNIVNTLILIGFVDLIKKASVRLIPSQGKQDEKDNLEYLSMGFLNMAEFSVLQAKKETLRYGDLVHRMFNFIPDLIYITDKTQFTEMVNKVNKYEEIMDRIEIEITSFLVKVSKNQLSSGTSGQVRRLRVICSEIEKIGDVCFKMSVLLSKKREEESYFTPPQREDLKKMFALINQAFDLMLSNLENGETFAKENLDKAMNIEKQINQFRDHRNEEVIDHIEKGAFHVKGGFYFNKLISSSEKIGDSIININEISAGVNVE
ncbi:MAG: Na/Pi cotransporter family protein [Bacteroidales bacterium]